MKPDVSVDRTMLELPGAQNAAVAQEGNLPPVPDATEIKNDVDRDRIADSCSDPDASDPARPRDGDSTVGTEAEPTSSLSDASLIAALDSDVNTFLAIFDDPAGHEAAHAVVRWLLGLKLTALWVYENGGGCCEGTGKFIAPDEDLFLTLAGYAFELHDNDAFLASDIRSDDIKEARVILRDSFWLRIDESRFLASGEITCLDVDDALNRWFTRTKELLRPHHELVYRLAARLAAREHLSARAVSGIVRRYEKEQQNKSPAEHD